MIQRDGSNTSLWQNVKPYTVTNNANELIYDVAVIGGGITGITTALLLQYAGKRCVVLEAYNIGYGTTGGTTAHINTLLDTPYNVLINKFGLDSATLVREVTRDSIRFIKSTIQHNQIECGFEEATAYLFAQDDKQVKELEDVYDACLKVKLDVRYSPTIQIPIPFKKSIEVPEQAKFHPLHYIQGLAKLFESAGGVIIENCNVHDREEDEAIVTLKTNDRSIQALSVVYATHIPPGINLLHLRCSPWRSYAMAVTLKDNNYPKDLIYDMYDPYHYYRTQYVEGIPYLIVGGEDHKTGHEENTEKCFLNLESHIRKYYEIEKVAYKWSSQFFESADGLPYIGHLPGASENVYVATGYGGNGMVHSTVAAQVLTDIILKQDNPCIELFSPSRIKPVAGFTNFVGHNADVVKQFVGKWLSSDKIETLADLAPGEGKVVKYENQHVALSKDYDGNVHAVNPTCTHMKCSVAWNQTEQSWDCPCHGARYSPQGKVITGPANKDLEQIEIQAMSELDHVKR